MSDRKKKKTGSRSANIVASVLGESGLAERVEQAAIIPEWPSLVGPQIAAVTAPQSITANGTLFVQVTTNAWMNELSLLEPELLRSLNAKAAGRPVRRIRWLLGPALDKRSISRCAIKRLADANGRCVARGVRANFYRLDPSAYFRHLYGRVFSG